MSVGSASTKAAQFLGIAHRETGAALKLAQQLRVSGDVDAVHIANQGVSKRMATVLGEETPFYISAATGASGNVRHAAELLARNRASGDEALFDLSQQMGGVVREARHATPYALAEADLVAVRQNAIDRLTQMHREILEARQRAIIANI